MSQSLIEFRFAGNGLRPGSIRSKEIAEIIEAVEEMIASKVISDNPELKKDSIIIGLSNVKNESLGLQFCPNLTELTLPATLEIAGSIASGSFNSLPRDTIKSLKKVFSFTRKHECNAEIYERNGSSRLLAVITPEAEIPAITSITGETTLYGEITRVGGADSKKPKIQFKTIDGQLIYCDASKYLAERAGSRLYQQVGLLGIATWNAETFEVEDFHVTQISDYEKTSAVEAFRELSKQFGEAFTSIKDVNGLVTEIRYGSVEE